MNFIIIGDLSSETFCCYLNINDLVGKTFFYCVCLFVCVYISLFYLYWNYFIIKLSYCIYIYIYKYLLFNSKETTFLFKIFHVIRIYAMKIDYICFNSHISISLFPYSTPPRMLIFGQWGYKTGSEARRDLCSIPNVLVNTIYTFNLVVLIFPVILYLHLCYFQRPCRCPYPLQVWSPMYLPPIGHLRPRTTLHRQKQIHDWYVCDDTVCSDQSTTTHITSSDLTPRGYMCW